MIIRLNVGGANRTCPCYDVRTYIIAYRERLWRCKARAHNGISVLNQIQPDQPRLFLESDSIPDDSFVTASQSRHHEGCSNIWVARKGQLSARREYPYFVCVCDGSRGGSTKVVSARLNSAATDCICSVVSSSPFNTTARGLPPNRRSVKTSTVTKFNCILCHPCRWMRALPFIPRVSTKSIAPVGLGMSALGQKQTYAVQKAMSALPQERTCAVQQAMSAKCQ